MDPRLRIATSARWALYVKLKSRRVREERLHLRIFNMLGQVSRTLLTVMKHLNHVFYDVFFVCHYELHTAGVRGATGEYG
jgi:hypothetical protein